MDPQTNQPFPNRHGRSGQSNKVKGDAKSRYWYSKSSPHWSKRDFGARIAYGAIRSVTGYARIGKVARVTQACHQQRIRYNFP
jgi:hypothetical protein